MPELPEVETMVRYLRERAIDGKVLAVRVHRNPGERYLGAWKKLPTSKPYKPYTELWDREDLVGQTLNTVGRRGKYMTFQFSDGIMVCHNAMSGFWDIKGDEWCFDYVEGSRTSKDSDVRVEIDVVCDKEQKTLRFHDARLFGRISFHTVRSIEEIPALAKLGPEALDTVNVDLTTDKSKRNWCILDVCMFKPKMEIKAALMDQEALAGVGNIYASEICHWAKIDPFRLCKSLNTDEWARIFKCTTGTLQRALDVKLDYHQLMVYRQCACRWCKGYIKKKELRGRSTFWCPSCQE